MRPRPRSRYEREDGSINFVLVGNEPEYPEVKAWRKEYADECDRLAELEAENKGGRHWGRWYLDEKSNALVTVVCRPNIGSDGSTTLFEYDIPLDRLNGDCLEHMAPKNWIGERGLQDLERVLTELAKEELLRALSTGEVKG